MAFKKPVIDRVVVDPRNNLIHCDDFRMAYKYLYLNQRASLQNFNASERLVIQALLGRISLDDLFATMDLSRFDSLDKKLYHIKRKTQRVAEKLFISFGRMTVIHEMNRGGSQRSLENSAYLRDITGMLATYEWKKSVPDTYEVATCGIALSA